ncbi:MAG: RnfABCDGE type electron transport complex subunit A [Bacteroidales bacterium]|nr:RnfABCDGE type electron transport complex subunit A [Bacteroidales bacterium]
MEYVLIIITAIFVNNVVLSQFLGICPFVGVSNKVSTAVGMSGAVAFVMVIATLVTYFLQKLLESFGIEFMQTITFILVIASLVQIVEIVLKKVSPALYQSLGIFLPLITTNCTVLGVAIKVTEASYAPDGFEYGALGAAVYALANAIGYGLALTIFAGLREQMELSDIPKGMKGVPIAFITAGILAMAFMGFAGLFQAAE